jgi:WD40 repeat protein
VSGGKDGKLRLWSAGTGEVYRAIAAHGESVLSIEFSPEGGFFASGGGDDLVHVWTPDGQRLTTLRGHRSSVHDLAFGPDGQSLASAGGFDRTVLVWDVPTWSLRERLDHPPNSEPLCVVFALDGKQLASAGYGGSIHYWRSGALLRSVAASESTIRCLAVQTNETILFGDRDGVLGNCAWDRGGVRWKRPLHSGNLRDLAVLSQHEIISVGDDGKVQRQMLKPRR